MAELEKEGLNTMIVEWPTGTPARISPAWLNFHDAVMEKRLTHDADPRLARHVQNMIVKSDRLGPRPVRDPTRRVRSSTPESPRSWLRVRAVAPG